jgi:hypothetical protein
MQLLDLRVKVWNLDMAFREFKAGMALEARSALSSPTPQLATPTVAPPSPTIPVVSTSPKVLSLPSLAWVPSPPSPAPAPAVLSPLLTSPAVPPGLKKPTQSLPPTTESTPHTFPTPKPDLGPVVHTIVHVTPEKASPPHPLSTSTTGVVLFSLLLLHHRGSCHWPVVLQLVISKPSGNRPDPEPPPLVHDSTVLRSELDIFLFVCFYYIFLHFYILYFLNFRLRFQSTIFNVSFLSFLLHPST